eukprot:766619-Hanusia_phi.AAC.2
MVCMSWGRSTGQPRLPPSYSPRPPHSLKTPSSSPATHSLPPSLLPCSPPLFFPPCSSPPGSGDHPGLAAPASLSEPDPPTACQRQTCSEAEIGAALRRPVKQLRGAGQS